MSAAETPLTAHSPLAAPRAVILPEQVPIGYTVDELYDFFDFFDATVDDVYAYILHCTRVPDATDALTMEVYLSLLQRRRFFYWKQSAKLATALALADRFIASGKRWREDAESMAYTLALRQCLPSGKEGEERRAQVLQSALRSLPFRAQRMTVLACFLRFPASRTALLMGAQREEIEREYAGVLGMIGEKLKADASFRDIEPGEYLKSLHCPPLPEDQKRSMRHLLLARSQSGRGMSIRFALPLAVMFLFMSSVLGLSIVPPLSAAGTAQRIAAAEVLLLGEELAIERNLTEAERGVRSIAASYAERELADIAINLAPYAVRKQVTQDVTVRRLLKEWEEAGRPLVSALEKLLTSVDTPPAF